MSESTLRQAAAVGFKTKTPEYTAWINMKSRCYNKSSSSYKNYGGRGIKVYTIWKNSFEEFLADVGQRPGRNWSLDRIDNDGHYEPGNVRWATRQQQVMNQRVRKDNKVGVRGVHKNNNGTLSPWVASIVLNGKRLTIGYYRTQGEAVAARLAFDKAIDAVLEELPEDDTETGYGAAEAGIFSNGRFSYKTDVRALLEAAKSQSQKEQS